MRKAILSFAGVATAVTSGLAHPGHGHISAGDGLHYVAEPVHGLLLVLAATAILLVRGSARQRFARARRR